MSNSRIPIPVTTLILGMSTIGATVPAHARSLPDGSAMRVVADEGYHTTWSPNGTQLGPYADPSVWFVNADGSGGLTQGDIRPPLGPDRHCSPADELRG